MFGSQFACLLIIFQKPAILDPTSDGDKILDYLKELLFKLNDLQDKAFQYKSYQKAFKVGYID